MNIFAQLTQDIAKLWSSNGGAYLFGIRNTIILALVATAIGCLIGLGCGILQTIPSSRSDPPFKRFLLTLIRGILRIYVEVFRGTPMVLQAVFVYYGLPYITGGAMKFTNVWTAAILVVSVNTGAYMAESVRGGILSIDPGQTEGAKAIGMTHLQTMTCVILPQAIRNIMPQIGNNFIINLKDSSVMFIITFNEFFAAHRAAVGATYLYFPSAVVEMIGYLTMTLIASFLLRWAEKRMDGPADFDLALADQLTLTSGTYNHPGKTTPFDEQSREWNGQDENERGDR